MAPSGAPPDAAKSVNAPSSGQETADLKTSPQNGKPPRKKLKLNVRKASIDADTIAVSRPKRKAAGRARYSEEVMISEAESEKSMSPADSSDLSSLDSKSLSVKANSPALEQAPAANRQKSYGDFASYYIMDGDAGADEEPKKETRSKPAPKSTKIKVKARPSIENLPPKPQNEKSEPKMTQLPTPATYPEIEYRPPPGPQLVQRSLAPPQLPSQQQQQRQTPTNVPPPMPVVSQRQTIPSIPPPEPPVMEEIKVEYHGDVAEMVGNLEDLSEALTSFGGGPKTKKVPSPQKPTTSDHDVLLAMFNDDSDSNEGDGDDDGKVDNERGRKPGEQDAALTYGIQFIMNALKSWAQQRLFNQYMQALQAGGTHNGQAQPIAIPSDLYNLSRTAEGKAILAFRRVVQSGCLQVNAVLPKKLADALCCLYVQIDVLINSGNKPSQNDGTMSYLAQIAAFETDLRKTIKQQAQVHQIAREQQKIANQQMMHQMGMQPVPHGHMQHHPHMSQHMPHDSQRRRSSSHAHRQQFPRPTPQGVPQGLTHSPANSNGPYPPPTYPGTPVNNMPPQHPPSRDSTQSLPSHGGKNNFNKVQMYVPGHGPRPNLGMKFSFAPTNPAAVQVFGAQAFPAPLQQGSNVPNRGPMANPAPEPTGESSSPPTYNSAAVVPRPNSTPNITPNGNGRPPSKRDSVASGDGRPQLSSAFPPPNGISAIKRNSTTSSDGGSQLPSTIQPPNGMPALKRSSITSSDGRPQPPTAIQPPNGKPAQRCNSITSNDSQSQQPITTQKTNGFTALNRPKSNGSTTSPAIVADPESGAPPKKKRKSRSDSMTASTIVQSTKMNGNTDRTSGFPHPGAVVIDE